MLEGLAGRLGRSVAPPRFVAFAVVFLAVAAVAGFCLADLRIALLSGFDAAALVFLVSLLPLLNDDTTAMRATAQRNDANRTALLAIAVVLSIVIFFATATLMFSKDSLHWQQISLIVGTLVLAWLFANTVFALHYAHLFYLKGAAGDRGGLNVPNTDSPGYWDFFYFSLTLGMTFQTSDITISGAHIRKVALGHSMAAFLFNMGILAFAVNALGGL